MMNLSRLIQIASQPWMLHGAYAQRAAEVLARRMGGERPTVEELEELRESRAHMSARPDDWNPPRGMTRDPKHDRGFHMEGAVAVVPVRGLIVEDPDMVNGWCLPDGATVADIDDAAMAAMQAPQTRALVVKIDSPGGTVAGGEDIVETLRSVRAASEKRDARSGKSYRVPIIGYGNNLCASGAMLLASQCDEFHAGANALVGSVGVYQLVVDSSASAAKWGETVHLVASGPYKGAGAPGTPVTPVHLDKFREEVMSLKDWFVARLAEGRGMDPAAAQAVATGEVWVGRKAVEVGLVDSIVGYRELLATLNTELRA